MKCRDTIQRFKEFLMESTKEKKTKLIFLDTDGKSPYPIDTITALKKQISVFARDLTQQWDSPIVLVSATFEKYNIAIPEPNLKDRWDQYINLLNYATERLYQARGFNL